MTKKYRATAKGKVEYEGLIKHQKGKHDYEIGSMVKWLLRHPNATREEVISSKAHDWGSRRRVRSNLAYALRSGHVTFRIVR